MNIISFGDQPITIPPSGTILNIPFQVLSGPGPWAIDLVDFDSTGYDYENGFISPTGPGDANLDGRVDINDLTIVLDNYGNTGQTWTQGCMDGDPRGAVDINDLTIVLDNYGRSYGASLGPGSAVPEPTSLLLLAMGVMSLLLLIAKNHHRQRV
jgi:hypothetical protein